MTLVTSTRHLALNDFPQVQKFETKMYESSFVRARLATASSSEMAQTSRQLRNTDLFLLL